MFDEGYPNRETPLNTLSYTIKRHHLTYALLKGKPPLFQCLCLVLSHQRSP